MPVTLNKNVTSYIMTPFYGRDSPASKLQSHYQEAVYFLPLSS